MMSTSAPTLPGTTLPGAQIGVEYRLIAHLESPSPPYSPDSTGALDGKLIQRTVAADAQGNWEFDFRNVGDMRQGTFEYSIWAYTSDEASAPVTGEYSTRPPILNGISAFNWLDLSEASSTGIVIEVAAAPGSTVRLTAGFQSQHKQIKLNENGTAVVQMLFNSGGYYWLGFQQRTSNDDGSWTFGTIGELAVDVFDPDAPPFGWFGPDPGLESMELLVQE